MARMTAKAFAYIRYFKLSAEKADLRYRAGVTSTPYFTKYQNSTAKWTHTLTVFLNYSFLHLHTLADLVHT